MAYHVLTRGPERRPVFSFVGARPDIEAFDGPAVLFEADGGSVGLDSGTPIATREPGEAWERLQPHVSDAWVRLPAGVRAKLLADPDAELSSDDLIGLAQSGVGVSAAFWVGSEDDPGYGVKGEMRAFVRLMSRLNGE